MSEFDLAPTADVPRTKGKDRASFYGPCPRCNREVLTVPTMVGDAAVVVMLDTDKHRQRCFIVEWDKGAAAPIAHESAAYPAHRCQP